MVIANGKNPDLLYDILDMLHIGSGIAFLFQNGNDLGSQCIGSLVLTGLISGFKSFVDGGSDLALVKRNQASVSFSQLFYGHLCNLLVKIVHPATIGGYKLATQYIVFVFIKRAYI